MRPIAISTLEADSQMDIDWMLLSMWETPKQDNADMQKIQKTRAYRAQPSGQIAIPDEVLTDSERMGVVSTASFEKQMKQCFCF